MRIWQRRWSNGPSLSRLAFGIVCIIGLSCPAAGPAVAAGDDENFFTHLHTGKAMANVTVSPARAGPVEITIQLETMDERPLTAKAVSVTLSNTRTGAKLPKVEAARKDDDRWYAKVSVPTPGAWTLGLGITISDTDGVNVQSPIVIR
jgi:hypothetical protein